MKREFVPAFYSPTTVVFIDDDLEYLKYITLKTSHLPCLSFNHPDTAIKFFNDIYTPDLLTHRCLSYTKDTRDESYEIKLQIPLIHKEIYNPKRFEQISVAIIDYLMPDKDGIEVCRQIKHPFIKKILLTGELGSDKAIEAFNNGLIDHYIRKDAPGFLQTLHKTIYDLQFQYFQDLSTVILDALIHVPHYQKTCLDDPLFIRFFVEFIHRKKPAEFYLVDATGSFLLLDNNAQAFWLIVKNEVEILRFEDLAKNADGVISSETLIDLKKGKKIFFDFNPNNSAVKKTDWNSSIHKATPLQGLKEPFYYAVIDNSSAYPLDQNDIVSYKTYLEQLD
jgi:CheY-like chemotaxis protein